jgi:hypothetical protein
MAMMYRYIIPFALWFLMTIPGKVPLHGQDSSTMVLFTFQYGAFLPFGDMGQRFGPGFSPGGELRWLGPSNWTAGLQGSFLFGGQVKEDVLANLRTHEGYIIGNDRLPADLQLRMRGAYLGGQVGKLWPLGDSPRSGIRLSLGAGWLYHFIRIQKDPSRYVAQVEGAYAHGYDRLAGGPAGYQWLGYEVHSRNGQVNLYIGLEILLAFTHPLRDYQFDLRGPETGGRQDGFIGLRAGWSLPWQFGKRSQIWY